MAERAEGEALVDRIEQSFGFLPSLFRVALEKSPELAENLFEQVDFALLSSPIPALFKERLATYLARFCPVPYCLLRHASFLHRLGPPVLDRGEDKMETDAILRLLDRPRPSESDLVAALSKIEQAEARPGWPEPGSELENAIFDLSIELFLRTGGHRYYRAIERRIGSRLSGRLLALLAMVETMHRFVEVHPDIPLDPDVEVLLERAPALARWIEVRHPEVVLKSRNLDREAESRLHELEDEVKRVEEQVDRHKVQEKTLASIVEKSLNEIYVFEAETLHVRHANDSACRNLGYPFSMLKRLTLLDIFADVSPADVQQLLAPLRSGERDTVIVEAEFRRRDGSLYPVEGHLQLLPYDGSKAFAAITMDITERKRAEAELRLSHDRLEKRVEERTRELHESEMRLRQARDEAEKATRAKSRMLATASHDLRQPVQSLGFYLSALNRLLEQEKALEISGKMQLTLAGLSELITSLLEVSRLERGVIEPHVETFDLAPLLEKVKIESDPMAEEKGLELELHGASAIVSSDPALLRRVIENLVSNAIRYTDQGQVVIETEIKASTAVISVRDTGVGIPPESLEEIFEEYVRLEDGSSASGLGLGLAIVQQLSKLLGLTLDVTSTVGAGSIFVLTVPLAESLNRSVLLVDDDAAIVDSTSLFLESMGHRVRSAVNFDEALAQLDGDWFPDVVISDYRLPGLDGFKVIEAVRERTGPVPAILMTADSSDYLQSAAASRGCSILCKPVDGEELRRLISSR